MPCESKTCLMAFINFQVRRVNRVIQIVRLKITDSSSVHVASGRNEFSPTRFAENRSIESDLILPVINLIFLRCGFRFRRRQQRFRQFLDGRFCGNSKRRRRRNPAIAMIFARLFHSLLILVSDYFVFDVIRFSFLPFDFDNPDFIVFGFAENLIFILSYQQICQLRRGRIMPGNDDGFCLQI